jgi:hypothetical protein
VAGPADVGHAVESWLCLLPASARRFRVADARLAAVLREAGAELVERSPDVEIGLPGNLRGDAPVAVASLGRAGWARGSLAARAAQRAAAGARVRLEALRVSRALRRLGYSSTETITWGLGQPFRTAGRPRARSAVELLPQCALVFGRRGEADASLLVAALAEASGAAGSPLTPRIATGRGGLMLAFTGHRLVRLAVGPGRQQLQGQVAALDELRASGPPETLAHLVPWPVAAGTTALADWAVEPLLPGAPAKAPLAGGVLAECLDFLVGLHSVKDPASASLDGAAALVARVCGEAAAALVLETGRRLDAALAEVPRGFGHGDFFGGNLLVHDGRLAGVVDWDAAGPGRLALLDLLHLVLTSRETSDLGWGPAIVSELLPWARRGGDALVRDYCRRVGMAPDPALLEQLVVAYWLDRAASQLGTHAEHWEDRDWIRANVEGVARALGGGDEGRR